MVLLVDDLLGLAFDALLWILHALLEVLLWILWTLVQASFEALRALLQRLTRRAPPESARARLRQKVERGCGKIRLKRAQRRGRCLLCREELATDDADDPGDDHSRCASCGVEVHTECRRELVPAGKCATLGCAGVLRDVEPPSRDGSAGRTGQVAT